MLFLIVLLCLCKINYSEFKDTSRQKYYGPSYQPFNWSRSASNSYTFLRSGDFVYTDTSKWNEDFPECGGQRQSPIEINTEELIKRKAKKPLKWLNYSEPPQNMFIQNSLHSIHISGEWKNSENPFITYGPFDDPYYFSQLHFHWGLNDKEGSEHLVNNMSYPLEMHLVHARRVDDSTDKNTNNLAVVSFMFEIIRKDNPDLKPIIRGVKAVSGSEVKRVNISPFPLDKIFKTFHGHYVTYSGSLTTPPCTEDVTWIISSQPLGISKKQIEIFRGSIIRDENPIRNYRSVQPTNERKIYYITC